MVRLVAQLPNPPVWLTAAIGRVGAGRGTVSLVSIKIASDTVGLFAALPCTHSIAT